MIVTDLVRDLARIVTTGSGPACALKDPLWQNGFAWTGAGLLAGALATFAGVVAVVLRRVFGLWHGHCAACGQCSVAAGWLTGAVEATRFGDEDLCPQHRDQATTGEPR